MKNLEKEYDGCQCKHAANNDTVKCCNFCRLWNALNILASLISKGSVELWPLFEKLEEELNRIKDRRNRLEQYIK